MEENKPLVTETEFPESDTDIISGDGTPITDTSDQNVGTVQEEKNTSESDVEENTEDSSTTNTEENGVEKDTTTEVATDPANDPATLESAILMSTYAALNILAEYVPTEYVNNSEPDIDAEHLNNTEQGLLRVTNLLNGAVDVINDLQSTVAKQASAIDTLNSKMSNIANYKTFSMEKNIEPHNEILVGNLSLPAGIWLVIGHIAWRSSQDCFYTFAINTRTIRANALAGGGAINSLILNSSATSEYGVRTYNGGTDQMNARIEIDAIKIA